ncbi:hypothetical protein [Consotaella salsifontis]|uniref:Uncharacterized protein n=1 Tax=Consotaella salsifontis TaxID=1365950 RepID=A0A1T4PNC3_9HYPH|nr:hypothetical protein [Consotaella salsifontis]SJZ93064.1 hypothetical protein SAMN05428963_10474 [Consotaella salsifontis]
MIVRRFTFDHSSRRIALIGGLGAVALVVVAIFDLSAALHGLLAALLAWIAVPVGALLLLLIHRLTGGRWGEASRETLSATARTLPLLALAFLPILLLSPSLFSWAANADAAVHPDVADLYLSPTLFGVRALVILGLWSALAWTASQGLLGVLGAALGLALYGLSISFAGIDWVLSLDPHFKSTAFAMSLAVSQLVAGIAFVALTRDEAAPATSDILALLVAFSLGLFYLDMMQFLVAYDGNLPDKASWYLRRSGPGEVAVLTCAFLGTVAVPFATALRARWRRSPAALQVCGATALVGVSARVLWLVLPEASSTALSWIAAATALLAIGCLFVGALGRTARPLLTQRKRRAHGA